MKRTNADVLPDPRKRLLRLRGWVVGLAISGVIHIRGKASKRSSLFMKKIVTKSELAGLCGVSPSRVSVWLKKGVIGGDAVIGEGATAKIDANLAMAQIKAQLDPSVSRRRPQAPRRHGEI